MSVFVGYATSFFRRSLGVAARLKSPTVPLYYRQPSGIAVFAPALIGSYSQTLLVAQLTVLRNSSYRRDYHVCPSAFGTSAFPNRFEFSVNTVHVTWKNWKYPPETSTGEAPALRPWWLRVGVCSMEIATGAFVAASLLIHRSRTVRILA